MGRTTRKSKYVQLAARLRDSIQKGELKIGDRLPSYTEMHRQFGVASATTQRVYALLEEENFVERRSGSGVYVADWAQPAQNRTNVIGLLVHSHYWGNEYNPPSQAMLAGIHDACKEHHQKVLLLDDEDVSNMDNVDGVIIKSDKWEVYSLGISSAVPQVLIGQQAENITCVKINDFIGGKLATTHLIECGHRRIACLVEGAYDETLQRIAGYQAALRQAGVDGKDTWIKRASKFSFTTSFGYLEWGRQHMKEWLKEGWQQLNCTAIVVQNDRAAIGVMQVLQEEGLNVPEDVSVIGFDGTHVCDLAQPQLTSIQVPYYEMGFEAVKVLLAQIEQPPQSRVPSTITLPVHLRKGYSVKNLAKEKNHAKL